MKNDVTVTAPNAEPPALVKQIGKTTYKVRVHFRRVHFSKTSRETMSDKIKRLLRYEVSRM